MDFLAQKFIAESRRVRAQLERIAQLLQGNTEATRKAADAQIEAARSHPVFSPTINVPPAVIHEAKENADTKKREDRRVTTEFLTLIFAVIYAAFAGFTWWEIHVQNINQSAATINAATTADRAFFQGKAALKQTRETFQMDERAWLGLKGGPETNYAIHIINHGKTPATNATDQIFFRRFNKPQDIQHWMNTKEGRDFARTSPVLNLGTLFPGQEVSAASSGDVKGFLENPPVKSGQFIVYMIGNIAYDTFGTHHVTHFCGVWVPALSGFDPGYGCARYNDAN